jgi:hypothetical protein
MFTGACQQIDGDLTADVRMMMYFNIILDFGIRLVPFLGDTARNMSA